MRFLVISGMPKGDSPSADIMASLFTKVAIVEADSAEEVASRIYRPGIGDLIVVPMDFAREFHEVPGFLTTEEAAS